MLNPIVRKFQYGQHTVTLETGMMARQATAAVMVSMDDTAVFVTVVGQKKAKPGQDFFPLTVNYQERTYAAGKIPGGFFRREGRPSEGETLIARLIDRPVRPLFPEGFVNEVQVIATVVSVNPQVNPDIVAMIGASAALSLSGIPFNGPIGAARVGYINDQYVLNPTQEELKSSKLDLVVAGTEAAVLMVESEAELLSEDQMLGAVVFGHEQQQIVIQNINDLVKEAGKPRWDWQPEAVNEALNARVAALAESRLSDAYRITDKQERYAQVDVIKSETIATLVAEDETLDANELGEILHAIEKNVVRSRVLAGEPRTGRRAAYRWPRKRHDPWSGRSYRRTAAYSRFRTVHPWRNAGAGYRDSGYRTRRAEHRRTDGRAHRLLPVPLQLPSVLRRRNWHGGFSEAS